MIGAHGFGYSHVDGRHVPAAQLGYVRIGSDVEIGAGTTIDRGTYGATTIGDGTKIDNLVQIAHNCRIGRHNLICSQVGIAGSTTTGDYVVMGGQAGLRDHVHIGTGARLSAMAGITNDVPDGAVMLGIPATPEREQKLKLAALAKLPEMRQEFKAMRRERSPSCRTPIGIAVQKSTRIGPSGMSDQHDELACWPLGAGFRCSWPKRCGGRIITSAASAWSTWPIRSCAKSARTFNGSAGAAWAARSSSFAAAACSEATMAGKFHKVLLVSAGRVVAASCPIGSSSRRSITTSSRTSATTKTTRCWAC